MGDIGSFCTKCHENKCPEPCVGVVDFVEGNWSTTVSKSKCDCACHKKWTFSYKLFNFSEYINRLSWKANQNKQIMLASDRSLRYFDSGLATQGKACSMFVDDKANILKQDFDECGIVQNTGVKG